MNGPIFVVGGSRDAQVPIDDLELLINCGSGPRERHAASYPP
jgi:esterase FrsA